jgi:N6-L-threonylcarbamoyladenine synthase
MRVLGIETTCDETAASVVALADDGTGIILSNEVLSQIARHAAYGGVVPEIAARAHVEVIDRLVVRALQVAGMRLDEVDGVAAAAGPGLIGGVLVGLTTAKTLALVARKPLLAVNHLEAHALTARLTDPLAFPYLLLLASGGHTQLLAVRGVGDYVRLGPLSTTPSARPSTRSPSFWVCPIRAGRKSSAWPRAAIPSASPCRARCSGAPNPISRCPA